MQVGYSHTRELAGHTRDSLVARYRGSIPGSRVESNEHQNAAQVIDDTLSLERATRDLIGEDCRNIERDVPGNLVVMGPKQHNGQWAQASTSLNYDPATKETTSFVNTLSTPGKNIILGHRFEDGNEIFSRTETSPEGFRETMVVCPSSGKPIQIQETYVPNSLPQEPQLRPNAHGGGLAMF